MFSDEEIAVMTHGLNTHYNHVIGDPWVDPPWPGLRPWRQEAIRNGVRAVRSGMTRRELHENWCRVYRDLGWSWGPVRDMYLKLHPCMTDYADLPLDQRRKDELFQASVLMLTRIGA